MNHTESCSSSNLAPSHRLTYACATHRDWLCTLHSVGAAGWLLRLDCALQPHNRRHIAHRSQSASPLLLGLVCLCPSESTSCVLVRSPTAAHAIYLTSSPVPLVPDQVRYSTPAAPSDLLPLLLSASTARDASCTHRKRYWAALNFFCHRSQTTSTQPPISTALIVEASCQRGSSYLHNPSRIGRRRFWLAFAHSQARPRPVSHESPAHPRRRRKSNHYYHRRPKSRSRQRPI